MQHDDSNDEWYDEPLRQMLTRLDRVLVATYKDGLLDRDAVERIHYGAGNVFLLIAEDTEVDHSDPVEAAEDAVGTFLAGVATALPPLRVIAARYLRERTVEHAADIGRRTSMMTPEGEFPSPLLMEGLDRMNELVDKADRLVEDAGDDDDDA